MGNEVEHQVVVRERERHLIPLLRRAERDPDAVGELWRAAGDRADFIRLGGGDFAKMVRELIVQHAVSSPLTRTALMTKAAELRDELAGPSPSPLERALAERAAVCYLDVHAADYKALRLGDAGPGQAAYLEHRRDRAHRRYLGALKALAQVRKLLGPGLTVNVNQSVTVEARRADERTDQVGAVLTGSQECRVGLERETGD